jgi:hypothetical protein
MFNTITTNSSIANNLVFNITKISLPHALSNGLVKYESKVMYLPSGLKYRISSILSTNYLVFDFVLLGGVDERIFTRKKA